MSQSHGLTGLMVRWESGPSSSSFIWSLISTAQQHAWAELSCHEGIPQHLIPIGQVYCHQSSFRLESWFFTWAGITSGMTMTATTAPTTFVSTNASMLQEIDHLEFSFSNLKYIYIQMNLVLVFLFWFYSVILFNFSLSVDELRVKCEASHCFTSDRWLTPLASPGGRRWASMYAQCKWFALFICSEEDIRSRIYLIYLSFLVHKSSQQQKKIFTMSYKKPVLCYWDIRGLGQAIR